VLCSFAYFFFPRLARNRTRVLRAGGILLLTTHGEADERWAWYEESLIIHLWVPRALAPRLPARRQTGHPIAISFHF
jgi:hypothetical protein